MGPNLPPDIADRGGGGSGGAFGEGGCEEVGAAGCVITVDGPPSDRAHPLPMLDSPGSRSHCRIMAHMPDLGSPWSSMP
eukprot:CAMPEP_0119536820 /NCGR_PEP_ID=MMETSP1344-20130328/49608_1 /TAXON_ID=236787 /ORGANISM="Florenciella parvula, Strain CCMP2471" /LENGTH=78 /DNA_ID=CAMNT_0007579067 /DNA_START=264 /DNA_END=496 /DNA_ORIENTATION=-